MSKHNKIYYSKILGEKAEKWRKFCETAMNRQNMENSHILKNNSDKIRHHNIMYGNFNSLR